MLLLLFVRVSVDKSGAGRVDTIRAGHHTQFVDCAWAVRGFACPTEHTRELERGLTTQVTLIKAHSNFQLTPKFHFIDSFFRKNCIFLKSFKTRKHSELQDDIWYSN